ncbi:MAG: hypothetical protein HYX56_02905 [Chloroflexi bacterium]|nr:hypothetical protein [Chloroflexota bacterium]
MLTSRAAPHVRRARPPKRAPVDWRRYTAQVRRAEKELPRFEHPLPLSLAISVVFTFAGLALLQLVGIGLGAGLNDLSGSIAGSFPRAREEQLTLGETQINVSAAPLLDGLAEFTKANEIRISGKVPSYAIKPDNAVELALNGLRLTTYTLGADGAFGGANITLPDGTSTIVATLVEGTTQIASTSRTVTVDRTPPVVTITRPKTGDTVEGPDVIVEGKTEAGAEVTVNDRALRPNPDGTFTERLVPPVGALKVTIVAKDKAGNEAKTELLVTVKQSTQTTTAGTVLTVGLDRAKVRPGETVVARIIATQDGKALADLPVTLQVGVITIGTYKTDQSGVANVGFAAPNHEAEDVAIVVLGGGVAGRATLTTAIPKTP